MMISRWPLLSAAAVVERSSSSSSSSSRRTLLVAMALLLTAARAVTAATWPTLPSHCDILIAGGSTAALAAALTAAEAAPDLSICLTEPTDWPGGQLTSSGVPALDYGNLNRLPENQPASLRNLVAYLDQRPGNCWVSLTCFLPPDMIEGWLKPRLNKVPNLYLFDRTVVRAVTRYPVNGSIASFTLTQRQFRSATTTSGAYVSSSISNKSYNGVVTTGHNDSIRTNSNSNSNSKSTTGHDYDSINATKSFENAAEWSAPLSQVLGDWYNPVPSDRYDKRVLNLTARVYIEATELGDVLMAGGLPASQGVEAPLETDWNAATVLDTCGQAATTTFFAQLLPKRPKVPDPAPAGGPAGGVPFEGTGCCCPGSAAKPGTKDCTWAGVWTYRRAAQGTTLLRSSISSDGSDSSAGSITAKPHRKQENMGSHYHHHHHHMRGPSPDSVVPTDIINVSTDAVSVHAGDISQQNWGHGNDLDNSYIFVPLAEARDSVARGDWRGGVNVTTLKMLEARAYGWFHYYNDQAAPLPQRGHLVLSRSSSGTQHGLSKLPYLRDTRRSVGLDGFRLQQAAQRPTQQRPKLGMPYNDTVALANYPSDCHGLSICQLPPYLSGAPPPTVPFYLPLRAHTNSDAPNLLVAGKTMAQSFFANSATRLHPAEWASGVAAGGTAVFMVQNGIDTTSQALNRVQDLRAFLNSSSVGQPLEWTGVSAAASSS